MFPSRKSEPRQILTSQQLDLEPKLQANKEILHDIFSINMDHYEIIISDHWQQLWDLEDLALAADVHPQLVEYFVEYGLLEPAERIGSQLFFKDEAIWRLKTILRLRNDVGINLPGIAIILDLTGKIEELQQEVEWLRVKAGL